MKQVMNDVTKLFESYLQLSPKKQKEIADLIETALVEQTQLAIDGCTNTAELNELLYKAISKSDEPTVVDLLLKSGADVTADNNNALQEAVKYGRTEIVRLLLKAGANINVRNNLPLRFAIVSGHTDIVKLLLNAGADATYCTRYEIIQAYKHGYKETVDALIKAGAEPPRLHNSCVPINTLQTALLCLNEKDRILVLKNHWESQQKNLKPDYWTDYNPSDFSRYCETDDD